MKHLSFNNMDIAFRYARQNPEKMVKEILALEGIHKLESF